MSTPTDNGDLEALHGQRLDIEQVHVTEDADGIPSWIKVEREIATVVIVPSLLQPRSSTPAMPVDTARQRRRGVTS
ncbi:hypothetical protein M1D46_00505 [Microbacterium sp. JZ70]